MLPTHKNLPEIELKVFNSGWVNTRKCMVLADKGSEPIRMPATFAMIRHPTRGVILYDTGYHTRFYDATAHLPYNILKKFTPVQIEEKNNAVNQLKKIGVEPSDVKTIIVGHGHVDHVPGVLDFPRAELIIDRREWAFMQGTSLAVFLKGYIKSLYSNVSNKIETVNFPTQGKRYGPFDSAVDLWGDGSMILVPLLGHTVGHMGLLVNLHDGKRYFFIGDAAWVSDNYLTLTPPTLIARLVLASYRDFLKTLRDLYRFHEENPDVIIVPCHCPETWERLKSSGIGVE